MLLISSQLQAIIGVIKNGLSSTLMTRQDYYKNSSQLLKISDNIKCNNGILEAAVIMRTKTNDEKILLSDISILPRFRKQMMMMS
jgi:dTDP-glucose pyrophosphorylase